MKNQLLINNKVFHFDENYLPCLIHYIPNMGGSYFSISMIVDLFLAGSKVLFFTAYPMAQNNFLQQTKSEASKVSHISDISSLNTGAQVIIIESGNEKLFLQTIEKLDDLNDRVVFLKNIEVFNNDVIKNCLKLHKIIFSGNIDECEMKKSIITKYYQSIILFSKTDLPIKLDLPQLDKNTGYLFSEAIEGKVSVMIEK